MKQWGFIVLIFLMSFGISAQTPGANYVAFTAPGPVNADIFVADLSTGRIRNLTNNQVQSDHSSWSGDGSQIAFNNVLDGTNPDIFIMDANGLNQRNLSNHPAVDVSPDWSPVSDEIAFASNRDGGFDIYTINAATGEIKRITTDGTDKNRPDWSPDGSQIAYWQSENGGFALKIVTVADGTIRTLVSEGENLWPAWSPDGSQIAVHSSETGTAQIYLVDVATGARQQITSGDSINFRPAWSSDGSRIIFVSNRNGTNNLFSMNADGTDIQPLVVSDGDNISPDWRSSTSEIDFAANPNLGQSAVQVSRESLNNASQEALGAGSYHIFAPAEANVSDYIRVRLEIALEDIETIPENDIPLRGEGDLTVYRYMGAKLTGLDLEDFEIYPTPTDYILQIQADDVNYWEWYLRPNGTNVAGEKLLFIEIYLPDLDDDEIATEDLIKRIPFTIKIVTDEPDLEANTVEETDNVTISYDATYLQEDVNPQEEAQGFSVFLNSENLLAISFANDIDVSDMSVASGSANYAILQIFPDISELYGTTLPANFCIYYEKDGTSDALPLSCQVETRLARTLNAGDVFWYNRLARNIQDVIIRKDGKTYVCSPAFERCDF